MASSIPCRVTRDLPWPAEPANLGYQHLSLVSPNKVTIISLLPSTGHRWANITSNVPDCQGTYHRQNALWVINNASLADSL